MKHIAILGLGNMGANIAHSLHKAGFALAVYNRTPERTHPFIDKGVKIAASPAEAVRAADAVISVVGDDAASKAVWMGREGALDAVPKGACIVECSTLSLEWVRELAALASVRQLRFADAGLGGGPSTIPGGTLKLFVGAEQATFDAIRPVLAAFSKEQFRFGNPGSGMAFKLINNMMIDVQVSALCEGIAMAERAGLDMAVVEKAIAAGSSSSPAVVSNIAGIMARKYEPASFQLRWMRKDAAYMEKFSREQGLHLPVAKAAQGLLDTAGDKGWMDRNWTAIAELYRK